MTKYTIEIFSKDNPICFECDKSKPGVRLSPSPADKKAWLCFDCFRDRINSGKFTLSDEAIAAEDFSRRGLTEHSLILLGDGLAAARGCKDPGHKGSAALTRWTLDDTPTCFLCINRKIKADELHLVSLSPEVEAILNPTQSVDTSNFEVQW